MKIGMVTLHRVFNYGSVLQTYALQQYLKSMGHEVEVIDYKPERFSNKRYFNLTGDKWNNPLKKLVGLVITIPIKAVRKNIFDKFVKRYIFLTKDTYETYDDVVKNCGDKDIYLTGSDQVWNSTYNELIDPTYFLEFAPKGKKRLAYAGSFGKITLDKKEIDKTKELLNKYTRISVREKSAIGILESMGRTDGVHVLDPSLLLDKKDWLKISDSRKDYGRYVLVYNLNNDSKIKQYAKKIAEAKGIKVVNIVLRVRGDKGCINEYFTTPNRFIHLFANAEYIVTDSFHGTAFSINFNRQFLCVLPPKYTTRLTSILELVNLKDRICKNELNLQKALKEINYNEVNKLIDEQRVISKNFLENEINEGN
ncbi:polysaccharide pyruvyl transferase family protein [Clostridium sp.]|mgnify:CR=1 FL=1|uniref:polysaccharide pyruvyl transferase family protein n=1 Tax=Clostridium sp. TaxID=1506 RepID=UPI002900E425|nr:polysaccharide pyruvyl transferase family protein [Clostridium sp.]MBS7130554.1 polysaccharide pyruvyl transferase family protein [Clostridium sp.]MDU2284602.1 polysaccharide pyruvyl transferase family protein [Clostridium sp.]